MNLIYRPGTAADIPELIRLGVDAYQRHEAVLGSEAWQQMKAGLSRENLYTELLETASCFVCADGNTLAGMVFLVPSGKPSAHFQADWAHIRLLGVGSEYSGKGISQALMQACIREATARGERTLALHTGGFMKTARKLYAAMGFEYLREIGPIFGQDYAIFKLHLMSQNTTAIEYEFATASDAEALAEARMNFLTDIYGAPEPGVDEVLHRNLIEYFRTQIPAGNYICCIARSEGRIVATGGLVPRSYPGSFHNPAGRGGYIINMYTDPEFRRQGIASGIVARLVTRARELRLMQLELHATALGEPVYVNAGFTQHSEPTYRMQLSGGDS